jgi:hypothetical protein
MMIPDYTNYIYDYTDSKKDYTDQASLMVAIQIFQ